MKLNKVLGIVVHESASTWGDAKAIRQWHLARGWSDIGYHGVILNGYRTAGAEYREVLDGKIEPGRSEQLVGAHCAAQGMNLCTLGVVMVGYPGRPSPHGMADWKDFLTRPYATTRQYAALVHWLAVNCRQYGLDPHGTFRHPTLHVDMPVITQHSQHDPGKPLCASVQIERLRHEVALALRK